MKPVRLVSNFRDYYDHWFATPGTPIMARYHRDTTIGPSRLQQFVYLETAGLPVPHFGILLPKFKLFGDYVVVYIDQEAHRGEGKIVVPWETAEVNYAGSLVSEFIPTTDTPFDKAVSYRCLFVGFKAFHLKYSSSDWRSNVGEVDIEILEEGPLEIDRDIFKETPIHQQPLLAIDYVQHVDTKQLACIDLNIAPGIKGTGLELSLRGQEVVRIIGDYISYVCEVAF